MTAEIELVDGENVNALRPNRSFWRYLFAGLALHDSPAFNTDATFLARDAVNRADALLAELEFSPPPREVVDLMAALKASLAGAEPKK